MLRALPRFVISLLFALIVDPLTSVFRNAMRAAAPCATALPRLIRFAQHPFQKRSYGKVIAGGMGHFRSFATRAALAVVVLVLLVVGAASVGHTGPPDTLMLAASFAGLTEAVSNVLVEKREQFTAKQKELTDVFELAKDGAVFDFSRKSVLEALGATDQADAVLKVKARNIELENLSSELQTAELKEIQGMARTRDELRNTPAVPGMHPAGPGTEVKSFGQLFTETKEFDAYRKNRQMGMPAMIDVAIKTLFETTAGFAPESVRSGKLVEKATRPIQILDLIPSAPISQAAEKYMEETTRTHSAAEKAEGVTFAESAFVWTEKTSDVRKITDSIPVTDEQLEDELQVRSLLDQRLRFGLMQRLDGQILVGNGTAPNLRGINNVVGIQTQAKGADPTIVAFMRALTLIRFTGRANPNGSVMHPNDWQDVLLTQTANGDFLFGNPFTGPGPQSLFGVPVAISDAQTENTGLVGDFLNFCRIGERRGVEVQVGYVNTQFTDGKITLRADLRACFTVYRPAAFCTITGI